MQFSKQNVPMDCQAINAVLNNMIMLQNTILRRFNSQEYMQYARGVLRHEQRKFDACFGFEPPTGFNETVCRYLWKLGQAIGLDSDTCEAVKRMYYA